MSVMITGLICTVILVLSAAILHHWGRKKRQEAQREMARHVRRDANNTAGWKEYQ
jgi:hypothetical protein